jgi:hypothetical protein
MQIFQVEKRDEKVQIKGAPASLARTFVYSMGLIKVTPAS